MNRTAQAAIMALAALLSWFMLGQMVLVEDVGARSAFDPLRLLFYALLLTAPVFTFVPPHSCPTWWGYVSTVVTPGGMTSFAHAARGTWPRSC